MSRLNSQKGALSLGGIIFLLIIAVAAYVGIKMAIPLIQYGQVKELFRTKVARLKVEAADKIKKEVYENLKEMDVTLHVDYEYEEEGLHIIIEEGKPAIMKASYSEDVDFPGGYKYTYTFNPIMESPTIVNPR